MVAHLRQTSAAFTELLTLTFTVNASRSIRWSVSRRYPFIPLLKLSVVAPAFTGTPHFYFVLFICPEEAGKTVNQSGQTVSDTACGWNQRKNCFCVGNDTGFNPLRIIGADFLTALLSSDNFCAELAIHILGRIGVVSDIQCRVLSPLLGNEKSLTRGLVRLGEYGIVICCYPAGACASRRPTA